MAHLVDPREGTSVKGIRPDGPVTIINVKWHGDSVVEVTYKDSSGQPGNKLIFREEEPTLEVTEADKSWSFLEILTALNKPDDFILAVVLVPPSDTTPDADPWKIEDPAVEYGRIQNDCKVYYVRKPFAREPDFGVTSVNYDLGELLANAECLSPNSIKGE